MRQVGGEPGFEVGPGGEGGAELVVAGEEPGVGGIKETAAVEENLGALGGGADEAAEGLVDLL